MNLKKLIFLFLFLVGIDSCYSQWLPIGPDSCIDMTVKGNVIFASLGYKSGVWKSENNGLNWIYVSNGLPSSPSQLLSDVSNIYALVSDTLYKSTNDGDYWFQSSNGINAGYISYIANNFNSSKIYAGCNSGLYISSNNGNNWNFLGLDTIRIQGIDFIGTSTIIITGSGNQFHKGIVFQSTNNGINWTNITGIIGNSNHSPKDVKIIGQNIFVNGVTHLYKKNVSSGTWLDITQNGFPNPNNIEIEGLFVVNQSLIVAIEDWNQPLFISINEGQNFYNISQGIYQGVGIYVNSVVSLNNYAYAGTYSAHPIYKRFIPEIIGIEIISNEIPKRFSLSQNYPNPFNPSTAIEFDIPKLTYTKLIVYDAAGKEVMTLVNEELNAGSYRVSVDGTNLSSGLYFYRLVTDKYSETRRMVLIK